MSTHENRNRSKTIMLFLMGSIFSLCSKIILRELEVLPGLIISGPNLTICGWHGIGAPSQENWKYWNKTKKKKRKEKGDNLRYELHLFWLYKLWRSWSWPATLFQFWMPGAQHYLFKFIFLIEGQYQEYEFFSVFFFPERSIFITLNQTLNV